MIEVPKFLKIAVAEIRLKELFASEAQFSGDNGLQSVQLRNLKYTIFDPVFALPEVCDISETLEQSSAMVDIFQKPVPGGWTCPQGDCPCDPCL